MIKKKQYATVIMFLGIFSALFVHMNIMTYSLFAQKNVYANYQTGADMSVSFEFGLNLTNTADFENLIQDVKAIAPNGEPLVEDAMVTYQHPHRFISNQYMYYVNFSNYLNFVSDKDKILPDRDFVATINALNDYNLNDPERDIYPGAIVNQKYLENNNVEVGNITYLAYEYYDSTQPFHTAFDNGYTIAVRIVGIEEYLPGVYVRPLTEESAVASVESIAVDTSDLPFQGIDTILHARYLHILLDLGNGGELNNAEIEDFIRDSTEFSYYNFGEGIYRFYIDKWVSLQDYESTDEINPLLVYKISYLIFIVLLIQVALGLPIILTSVRRKEQYYYGLLMSRGFGKKGIFRFILGELFVINFLAILGGIAIGILSSTLTLLIGHITNPYAIGNQFRLFLNPIDLIVILGSTAGISLVIFLVEYLISTRKSISEYLSKF